MRRLIIGVVMMVTMAPSAASAQPAGAPRAAKAAPQPWGKVAKEICAKAMSLAEANKILDPRIYVDECVDDCVLSGSFDFVEVAKMSYLDAVRRLSSSIDKKHARSKVAKHRAALEQQRIRVMKVHKMLGIGGKGECPKKCSGHGTCTPGGCECKPGFTGLACEHGLPPPPPPRP